MPGCEMLADVPEKGVDGQKLGRVLGIVFVSAVVADGMSLMSSKMKGRAGRVRNEVCGLPVPDLYECRSRHRAM